jgi:methylmalonyl-CoA mutase N-terminal domain/subunit
VQEGGREIETLYVDESAGDSQLARLAEIKATRDGALVRRTLDALRLGAGSTTNLMPLILDAVRAYATLGETCDVLREVWGEYVETPTI